MTHRRMWAGSSFGAAVLCALVLLSAWANAGAAQTESPLPPLHAAVERSDYRAALDLLHDPSALDAIGPFGDTALHYAARKGTPLMVSLLLAYGADPQALNEAGQLPVRVDPTTRSVSRLNPRRRQVLDAFIDHYVQEQPTGFARRAQLRFRVAAVIGDVDMARAALRDGASPNAAMVPRGETVLHGFAHPALLADFISMGADLEQRDVRRRTPLRRALEDGDADMVEAFLRAGARLSEQGKRSDLQVAISAQPDARKKMVRNLLAAGAPIRPVEWMIAVRGKQSDVVALFLRHGGPFDLNDPGASSLLKSALNGQGAPGGAETLRVLQKDPTLRAALESRRREMDAESRAVFGELRSFARGHFYAVMGLITAFALLACAPAMLLTRRLPAFILLVGLLTAAMTHLFVFTPVVSSGIANFRLLGSPLGGSGIDLVIYALVYVIALFMGSSLGGLVAHFVPAKRKRALMFPGSAVFVVVLAVLVMHQVSLIQWPTTLYFAISGHTDRMAALEGEMEQDRKKKRAAPPAADPAASSPAAHEALFEAVDQGSSVALEAALSAGADIGVRDEEGRSALHRAAEVGNAKMIAHLVDLGADVNARDDRGRSPLYRALGGTSGERARESVTALLDAGADANLATASGDSPLCLLVRLHRRSDRAALQRLLADYGARYRLSDRCIGRAYLADREGTLSRLVVGAEELEQRRAYSHPVRAEVYAAPWLWYAARSHDKGKVLLLLDLGADPESRDTEFGRTPLQVAVDTSQPGKARDTVVALLRGGADPRAVAWDGRTMDVFDRHDLIASIPAGQLRTSRD